MEAIDWVWSKASKICIKFQNMTEFTHLVGPNCRIEEVQYCIGDAPDKPTLTVDKQDKELVKDPHKFFHNYNQYQAQVAGPNLLSGLEGVRCSISTLLEPT